MAENNELNRLTYFLIGVGEVWALSITPISRKDEGDG